MLRYKLSEAARLSSKAGHGFRRIVLPAPTPSIGAERGYLKAERDLLRGLRKAIDEEIMPRYTPGIPDALPFADARIGVQDVSQSFWNLVEQVKERLLSVANATVNRILRLEGQRHSEKFVAIVKSKIGVDLKGAVRNSDLEGYLEEAARRNANLIKNLADQTLRRIQERVTQATLNGESHAILRSRLAKEFGLSDSRARLIARDQIGKLTSDLNRLRQEQAGIEKYAWSGSLDERERELHVSLEGRVYRWGERTGAEEGLPPGQPIQCRCVARPIVEFGGPSGKTPTPQRIPPDGQQVKRLRQSRRK